MIRVVGYHSRFPYNKDFVNSGIYIRDPQDMETTMGKSRLSDSLRATC